MPKPVWCCLHAAGVIYINGENEQEARNSAIRQLALRDLQHERVIILDWLPLECGRFLSKLNGTSILTTNI